VSVSDVSAAAGEKVAVPIDVLSLPGDIYGIDLWLEYSPGYLQYINVEAGASTAQWNVVAKESDTKNKVAIGLYSSMPLPRESGSIAVVNFVVKTDAPYGMTGRLHISKAEFNEKPARQIKDGIITVLKR